MFNSQPEIPAQIKVAFFDLDGTLVNREHVVSEASIAKLTNLQRNGIEVCLATGRPLFGAAKIIQQLSISSASMFFSGALGIEPIKRKKVFAEPIESALVRKLLFDLVKNNFFYEIYTEDGYHTDKNSPLIDIHAQYLGQHAAISNLETIISNNEIYKMEVVTSSIEEESRLAHLMAAYPEFIAVFAPGAAHPQINFANITSSKASRVHAFHKFLEHFSIKAENVIAFGDAESDIPFLQLAGIGVAMGNAPEKVKAAANFVTKSVSEDGVAFALNHFKL